MTGLPTRLQRAPRIFYALAFFYAVYNVIEPLMEVNQNIYSGLPTGSDDLMRFAYFRLITSAIYRSLFLYAFGVLAELLIAIWLNTRPLEAEEDAQ